MGVREEVENIKLEIMEEIRKFLKETNDYPIDLHEFLMDTVHRVLDYRIAVKSEVECLQIIQELNNEKYMDPGLFNIQEGISALLKGMAYESIYIELFDDDFINSLQREIKNKKEKTVLLKELEKRLYGAVIIKPKKDTKDQLLDFEPFTIPLTICDERKIIFLHNAIKVFSKRADSKNINRNALVFEGKRKSKNVLEVNRIYVMHPTEDIDLRNIKHKLMHPNRNFLYNW